MKTWANIRAFGLAALMTLAAADVATAQEAWPHPIPCRTTDNGDDIFVMVLGDVETDLAQGMFDPVNDRVTKWDGTTVEHYYRDVLETPFYKPIDKSIFPLPPSGWCSWYYYYGQITAAEVKANARWIAENLKDFGAEYVQIDDGWQGGGGQDGGRDWSRVRTRQFPEGMEDVADYIKSLGLKPGIWLAPHGQSRRQVVDDNPKVFLLGEDGQSLSNTWEGAFLVDPRPEESHTYLKDIFSKLREQGYVYFKIDGQPIVVNEYASKVGDEDHALYRKTLESIRSAIGDESYLLGCWGIPTEGMGIMDGSRTAGDVVRGWQGGFTLAARATMGYFYQHNVIWYTDADTMLLRSPLTADQARAWASLQGLTGQALMGSDRLMDLGPERVEMLRRIYPAVDIRPLDLFPSRRNKRVWDLKVSHLGRRYDVVGIFNYDENQLQSTNLQWKDLALPADRPMHVFDFWNKEYLGAWEAGMKVDVAPTSVRVLTLLPSNGKIQLISTNRHMTQGWVDLVELKQDETGHTFAGRSRVIKNDTYELSFAYPRGEHFSLRNAMVKGVPADKIKIENHQGWATVSWTPGATEEVDWMVEFGPASESFFYRPEQPTNLEVAYLGLDGFKLSWSELYWLNSGYQVYLDDQLLGYTPRSAYEIKGLDPNKSYKIDVATVWEDGTVSRQWATAQASVASMLPKQMSLSTLEAVPPAARMGGRRGGGAQMNAIVTIGNETFDRAISLPANGRVSYDTKAVFSKLTASVAITGAGSSEAAWRFVVRGDDNRELWRSDEIRAADGLKPVDVDVSGVKRLQLSVEGGGGGAQPTRGTRRGTRGRRGGGAGGGAQAVWVNAKLTRSE